MTKYALKIAVKAICLITLIIVASVLMQSPVITNALAMTQMENSNELYTMVSMYEKFVPVIRWMLVLVDIVIACSIGSDIRNIIKIHNIEKEN